MRVRSTLALALATALLVLACTGPTATPTQTAVPTTAAPTTAAPTTAPPTDPPAAFKVGVVTDVGTVDDKNFNEYSYQGAVAGAAAINAGDVSVAVPDDASQYASLIQDFIDTDHNIIVTVGFALADATAVAALANTDVWFIGVDQAPCIDEAGAPDPTFTCAGDLATLLPNFVGLQYAEDQAGYLAGIVAADHLDELVGIVTISDINRADPDEATTVGQVMTPRPVTVEPDTPVSRALERMAALGVGRLPVGRHGCGAGRACRCA